MYLYYTNKYNTKEIWPVSPEFIFEVGFCIKAAIEYCKSQLSTHENAIIPLHLSYSTREEDVLSVIRCLETYVYIYSSCLIRDDIPVISVDTQVCYEFWTEFTSYWNIFCQLELEGLYLFILSCRTVDSFETTRQDVLFLSKYTIPAVMNTLEVLYPFEKRLGEFISFLKKANSGCIYFSISKEPIYHLT